MWRLPVVNMAVVMAFAMVLRVAPLAYRAPRASGFGGAERDNTVCWDFRYTGNSGEYGKRQAAYTSTRQVIA
jgi:hypothetical protein